MSNHCIDWYFEDLIERWSLIVNSGSYLGKVNILSDSWRHLMTVSSPQVWWGWWKCWFLFQSIKSLKLLFGCNIDRLFVWFAKPNLCHVSNLIVYNSDPRSTRPLVSSSNEGYNPRWVNPLTRAHCTYNRPAESTSGPRAHWHISNENIALKFKLFN